MAGPYGINFKATAEQHTLLNSRHFTLRPLGSAGVLDVSKVLENSWQPIAIFVLTTLILSHMHNQLLCAAVLFALLVFPFMELLVLLVGTISTAIWRGVKGKAVVFWMWWPFWKLAMCAVAVAAGTALGNYLWQTCYSPFNQLSRMQVYENVNPLNATGIRYQDAGIMTFTDNAGVNRRMNSCFKNSDTICIAPIVAVNQQGSSRPPVNMTQYDLFMVGINCCDCPGDFRCGDWDLPGNHMGGSRVVDEGKIKQFRLATEQFATSYRKVVKNPIFFFWHDNPAASLDGLVTHANTLLIISMLCAPLAFVGLTVLLNGALQLLVWFKFAGPQGAPVSQQGVVSRMSQRLLPRMHDYHQEEVQSGGQGKYVQF
eukprot:TRINITY_DN76280_c0_g1_i1.p1 TRINITY_DN76280_c0_g1~~TRINITY_DN76280_c0_g1_i1.p1  ORF type:complete len:423 (+),score=54.85 TRINITY_DN76280_c0_g1_i1:158-1270(+)